MGFGRLGGIGRDFGSFGRSIAAAQTTVSAFDGVAATRARPLTTSSNAVRYINSRTIHYAVGPISQLKVAWGNFQLVNNPAELTGGGAATYKAWVEYPVGSGNITQLPIGGSTAAANVADGALIITDFSPILPVTIPDRGQFAIIHQISWATKVVYNAWQNTGLGDRFDTGLNPLADPSAPNYVWGNSFKNSCPPLAIIAKGTLAKSVCLIGDSKVFGLFDTAESGTAATPGSRGEIARSFQPNAPSSAFPDGIPFVNIATGSSTAQTWTANALSRRQLYPFFTHFVVQLGFNDILTTGRTAAQWRADYQSVLNDIKAQAVVAPKITACTLTPKSTSTDQWTTIVGQTAVGGNAQRVTANTMIRGGTVSTDVNNGYFEIADQVENTRDSGIWKANGLTPDSGITHEGIHETPTGYGLIQASGAVDLARLIT